jgi:uncharacterized membrane protein (Fun14 family)
MWKRRRAAAGDASRALRDTYRVALIVAGVSVLGFLLQALPGVDQVNADVIALAMPLHLGVVLLLLALRNHSGTKA